MRLDRNGPLSDPDMRAMLGHPEGRPLASSTGLRAGPVTAPAARLPARATEVVAERAFGRTFGSPGGEAGGEGAGAGVTRASFVSHQRTNGVARAGRLWSVV